MYNLAQCAIIWTKGRTMIEINEKILTGYSFIDLFAGLGGFRIALESLGANCVYSNEWNKPVQQVYKSNFGEIPYTKTRFWTVS